MSNSIHFIYYYLFSAIGGGGGYVGFPIGAKGIYFGSFIMWFFFALFGSNELLRVQTILLEKIRNTKEGIPDNIRNIQLKKFKRLTPLIDINYFQDTFIIKMINDLRKMEIIFYILISLITISPLSGIFKALNLIGPTLIDSVHFGMAIVYFIANVGIYFYSLTKFPRDQKPHDKN